MIILLVEDHHLLAETIMDYLATENIEVDYASRGLQGLELATTQTYDAIVLDINLPEIDGFTICQQLRENHNIDTPVLMLTARDQLDDKLTGFDCGADDYLIKPFANQELVARLTALMKRQRGEVTLKRSEIGDLTLDSGSQRVWRANKELILSPTGFRILRILMRESPEVVSREAIQQELWGHDIPDTDVLRSHIYNLRKVVDHPFEFAMIQTVKGIGLRLVSAET
ncbi:MAG: response regulator transcription factor [Thiolinea sp.]